MYDKGGFKRYFQNDTSDKKSGPLDLKRHDFQGSKINGQNVVGFEWILSNGEIMVQIGY